MSLLERLTRDPCPVGQRLPSIRVVAAAYRIHRNTVAAAYVDLARFGLIRSEVGSGSFASRPLPGLRDVRSVSFHCREPELTRLISAEIGHESAVASGDAESASPESVLLQPLDLAPAATLTTYPLAPSGETLAGIRMLRDGSTAIIVSKSSSVRRLMRSAIRAIHGSSVGVMTLRPETASTELVAQPVGDVPCVLFHDVGHTYGCFGISSCAIRLLVSATNNSLLTGTAEHRRSYG